ncbi:hypothetical protein McpCs1_15150 [Methanocorpusculaceae archaeon Cs1]|uniref:Uncharacterized protein n=1 Tax=Methanorbis rubei TaxID=3028300 RepID=A0AAE4MH29_9EURY|nr:hypothetical protein [Methanocorpusculaceae archaeon Cs1]
MPSTHRSVVFNSSFQESFRPAYRFAGTHGASQKNITERRGHHGDKYFRIGVTRCDVKENLSVFFLKNVDRVSGEWELREKNRHGFTQMFNLPIAVILRSTGTPANRLRPFRPHWITAGKFGIRVNPWRFFSREATLHHSTVHRVTPILKYLSP